MSDYYTEQLVKKQAGMKDIVIKAALVAVTIVSVLIVFLFPFGIILPVLAVILDVLMFRRLNVEYEYLFVNGDLDIDKIMNKAKRKRMFSANVNDLEILAPADSIEVRQYQKAKTYNYSSGSGQAALYALVVSERGEQKKIIFEPNDTQAAGERTLRGRRAESKFMVCR